MAKSIFTGVRIFAGGADLTGASNKCELSASVEAKDATTYGSSGWNESIGGLQSGTYSAEGFWEAADPSKVDDSTWANLGALVPLSVGPLDASVGSLAYFTKTLSKDYTFFGQVGDVAPWKVDGSSTWPVVRGQFAHPPGTARTSSGTGTGVQGAAVTTGKQLYGALHVLSVSGTASPTLTVTVESDDNSGFTTPTTVLSFTAATAITSEILREATVSADTWYRVKWTISGTSPSFTFVVALGVA